MKVLIDKEIGILKFHCKHSNSRKTLCQFLGCVLDPKVLTNTYDFTFGRLYGNGKIQDYIFEI